MFSAFTFVTVCMSARGLQSTPFATRSCPAACLRPNRPVWTYTIFKRVMLEGIRNQTQCQIFSSVFRRAFNDGLKGHFFGQKGHFFWTDWAFFGTQRALLLTRRALLLIEMVILVTIRSLLVIEGTFLWPPLPSYRRQ